MRKQWSKAGESGKASLAVRVALCALMLGALTACGGGGGGGGSNPAGSTGPVRTTIGTQSGTVAPQSAAAHPVSVSPGGTIDATVDWGSPANDFDIFVTSSSCNTSDIAALERGEGNCSHIVDARSSTTKPERVTWSGTAGTTYQIWVANFGVNTDSYTLTAGVTR